MSDVLTFTMAEDVARAFPEHATGLVRIVSAGAVAARPGAGAELADRYRADGAPAAAGVEHWTAVYTAMGAKPKYSCSVARLRDLERQTGTIAVPVALVEFYCWFSLMVGVPMAGYRTEAITGALQLTVPGAGVPFTALGQTRGSQEKTKPREVAYVDEEKAICRYWNYRDCDQTKLVDGLVDVVFVFDLVGAAVTRFSTIADEFVAYLEPGKVDVALTSAETPTVEI